MKRLLFIFMAIMPFFTCFSMEREGNEEAQRREEQERIRQSIIEQTLTNFASPWLPLHSAIHNYQEKSMDMDDPYGVAKLNALLNEIKNCIQEGGLQLATIDTIVFTACQGLGMQHITELLIRYDGLKYKLINGSYYHTTPEEIEFVLNHIDSITDGATLLANAILTYNKGLVDVLLLEGANPNIVDKQDNTPLMQATAGFFVDGIKLLLEFGAQDTINAQNKFGHTALHHLSCLGSEEHMKLENEEYARLRAIIDMLIAHGANPTIKDNDNMTALFYAANGAKINLVMALLDSGILKHFSYNEKELIMEEAKHRLGQYQRDTIALQMQDQQDPLGGNWRTNLNAALIKIFESIINCDIADEQNEKMMKENEALRKLIDEKMMRNEAFRKFMLEHYKAAIDKNPTFCTNIKRIKKSTSKPKDQESNAPMAREKILEAPINIFRVLREAELEGARGTKNKGLKRLVMNDTIEKIDYVQNYIKPEDDKVQEPAKKKHRTK